MLQEPRELKGDTGLQMLIMDWHMVCSTRVEQNLISYEKSIESNYCPLGRCNCIHSDLYLL